MFSLLRMADAWRAVRQHVTMVGWDARGGAGSLVARRVVEVDCGAGLAKRFVVQTPVG